jgi:hypothetical protein
LVADLENIFLFLTATAKTKNFLCKSNIKLPACVDFRAERMDGVAHCDKLQSWHKIDNLDSQNTFGILTISKLYNIPVYKITKMSCKVQDFLRRHFLKGFLAAVRLALPDIFQPCPFVTLMEV